MKKKTYTAINWIIFGIIILTFFLQTFPYLLPKENILAGEPTLINRLAFTSGITELESDNGFMRVLLMNSMFILFFVGNKLFYEVNKK